MKNMTTDGKLLAQDDIDALLGEAGIEGNYESETKTKEVDRGLDKKSKVRFSKRTNGEIQATMNQLYHLAFLEREEDVQVIWNALGTVPLASGLGMKIQGVEYISLGVLRERHLVVKHKS
ncbi:MAG: hypothetical protein JW932_18295 [Deltaproteobacteria bacterium]|nr:hypothetical protein [Deltaproteobacteria bacterium]